MLVWHRPVPAGWVLNPVGAVEPAADGVAVSEGLPVAVVDAGEAAPVPAPEPPHPAASIAVAATRALATASGWSFMALYLLSGVRCPL